MPASATSNRRRASARVGKAQLEARRSQPEPRQRAGKPRVDVAAADDGEAELRVQLARPVVGERLEEHEIACSQPFVERVLDDRAAEPAAAKLFEHLDVLDLRDAVARA